MTLTNQNHLHHLQTKATIYGERVYYRVRARGWWYEPGDWRQTTRTGKTIRFLTDVGWRGQTRPLDDEAQAVWDQEVVPQLMAEEMDQAFVEQLEREGFRVLSRVALGAGDLA